GGARIRAYDPEGMEAARPLLSDVTYASDAYDCAQGADAVVIVTEWNAFRALDFARLATLMAAPVMVDLRNVYTAEDVRRRGFRYTGIGQSRAAAVDADPDPGLPVMRRD
ncbi:UDP binding domain-containing protein, partial [Methylobacterium goesingense]